MNGNDSDIRIKTEPGLVSGRLSSFKPPRDLTLGGNKATNKKVFVPNLNVVRNKNKSNTVSNSVSKDGKSGNAPTRGPRSHGSAADKQKPVILKAGGVFSEGVAASTRHSSRGYSGSREGREDPGIQKPTFKPKETPKLDKEYEAQQVKELTDNQEELDLSTENFAPTKLPISKQCDLFIKKKPKDDVVDNSLLPGIKVKSEPMDLDVNETMLEEPPDLKLGMKIKKEFENTTDAQDIFQTQTPTLILLQFPDSLPGRGPEDESDAPNPSNSKEPTTEKVEQKPKINICTAKHLEEGQIGKIQILKSGKIRMLIGNMEYDLSLGSQACFRQDVMSVNAGSETVVNLGSIQSKVTIIPNWEYMFQKMDST